MTFDSAVIAAVTGHMNGDHADDNLLIARAFGRPDATAAVMTGLDADAGAWRVTDLEGEHELVVPWPDAPMTERPQIRRAVVLLYRQACERLGVTPREEHQPTASEDAGHHHTAGHHGSVAHDGARRGSGDDGFARRVREATWGDHADSEGATFMADIVRGRGTLADYTQLVAQHHIMYEALEAASELLLGDELLAALHPVALRRAVALERDLESLIGPEWRDVVAAVPATAAYAERIRAVAASGWLAGVVAHHYTRYLGDLSGGQLIARRVGAQFGLDGAGTAFYDFTGLGDLGEFKHEYRRVLDAFGSRLDAQEQARMLGEVRAAYRFNTEVFIDLGTARAAA